jgi:hypothetical protein
LSCATFGELELECGLGYPIAVRNLVRKPQLVAGYGLGATEEAPVDDKAGVDALCDSAVAKKMCEWIYRYTRHTTNLKASR